MSAAALSLASPAKLNLFLEVLGRRADGYHELETVMQTVSLCDTLLFFDNTSGIEVTTDAAAIPGGPANLAYRAAALFFRHTGRRAGIRIAIRKRIPAGGGFGGGSSNAAAALVGLDHICGTRLAPAVLMDLGAQIGSDVPFFIRGGTAVCRGRGERMEPVACTGTFHYLVVAPPVHCPTPAVFGHLAGTGSYPDRPRHPEAVLHALQMGDIMGLGREVFNRLEDPATGCLPALAAFRAQLDASGCGRFTMTGSGSAFFQVLASRAAGAAIRDRLLSTRAIRETGVFLCEGNGVGARGIPPDRGRRGRDPAGRRGCRPAG
ncbi:MAG: 4-(cytidine 5'-diphospho)-2-C-methyl-D-erythritol kinase [Planctomycetota bacterium]